MQKGVCFLGMHMGWFLVLLVTTVTCSTAQCVVGVMLPTARNFGAVVLLEFTCLVFVRICVVTLCGSQLDAHLAASVTMILLKNATVGRCQAITRAQSLYLTLLPTRIGHTDSVRTMMCAASAASGCQARQSQ